MVLHNPNNWHWVNKDTSEWARSYLEQSLVGISAAEKDVSAKITRVVSMDGDVDVSQRKGKVITLFDVKVQLEYGGATKDEEDVSGTITIPEVAHDTEEDEYVVRSLCQALSNLCRISCLYAADKNRHRSSRSTSIRTPVPNSP